MEGDSGDHAIWWMGESVFPACSRFAGLVAAKKRKEESDAKSFALKQT